MAGGRPRTSMNDLPKDWKNIMRGVAENGGSEIAQRVKLGITKDQWYSLKEHEPEFSEFVKETKDLCQLWWESMGVKGLVYTKDGDRIQPKIYELHMMNRFGWNKKEQHDIDANVDGNIQVNINTSNDKKDLR